MKKEFITSSPIETKNLAKEILKFKPKRGAFVIGLKGELGSGKTTFAQGFAKSLGIKERILSPTFVLCKKFQISNPKSQTNPKSQIPKFKYFYHFDFYRIIKSEEILSLGFKEIISNPKNIVLIEWADKIKKIMPKNTLWINFKLIDKSFRKLSLN